MADIKDDPVTTKEGGPPAVKFPMLTSSNYTVWSMKMKIALKVSEVWEVIDPGTKDEKKNNMAIAYLFQSVPEALVLQIERVREARLQTLMAEFDRTKMKDGDTIDVFVGKLSEITSKAAALGEIIDEPKLVKKFLKSLPRKRYIQIVASIEQMLDLKTTSFEDIVGRLKVYEERISEEEEDDAGDDQTKLMYADSENYGGYGKRRGRGGRTPWRGRGRGR
ncbi:uncharacterized protein LOC130511279 [Raphanus sativus]|uniref:Uncharacterized protein LOC130511279 n=1 Tax=Raphanus sativus TaxID=3726 RepID=A0A9W3DJS8_RAPSA|nr:uncharacterized protein LOC130511279 [Raphanus sativus]